MRRAEARRYVVVACSGARIGVTRSWHFSHESISPPPPHPPPPYPLPPCAPVRPTPQSLLTGTQHDRPHTARPRTSLERSIDADIADRQLRLEFLDRLDDLRSEHARNQAYLKRLYEEKAKRKLGGSASATDGGRPAFMSRDGREDEEEEEKQTTTSTRRGSAIYQSEYEDDFEMAEDEQLWNEMEGGGWFLLLAKEHVEREGRDRRDHARNKLFHRDSRTSTRSQQPPR